MADWSIGDVVTLASGGPNMTVILPLKADIIDIKCAWFDREGKLQHGEFPSDSLVDADTEES